LKTKKILILDYSTDKSGTPNIKQWMPVNADTSSLFIYDKDSFPSGLINYNFTHVIHSGSSHSITGTAPFDEKAEKFIQDCRNRGVTQMGICYGHQLVCRALLGRQSIQASPNKLEAGWEDITFNKKAMSILNIGESERIWQHHFDEVIELPKGSEVLATNAHTEIQAYINYEQRLFGTQFHPEVDRKAGNEVFLKDRDLLEKYNYNVEIIVKEGPSIEAGKVFFDFFLNDF
jgi:GMP synthase-like glutamine amidotransferase